ncbi:MAG: outer membrane protein assembly factor BamA [Crocinitomicaceae bacterium]|nr:outer membrane protein assembly factor BamA [Crocinitomicaceae bacterium]|tara:strand:- start:8208 stop:10808 length:2601 start_codon:yes stop_codon:yes gene_type:complete
MTRLLVLLFLILSFQLSAQIQLGGSQLKVDYSNPKEYKVGGITVSGAKKLDEGALILISGLKIGRKITIPGSDISKAVRKLWKQGLFEDVRISYTKVQGDLIFLDIYIKEQPRLSRFKFIGIKKSEANDLRDEINLYKEKIVTDNLMLSTRQKVEYYFIDKGYLKADVNISIAPDPQFPDHVYMTLDIVKYKKVKIHNIAVVDNHHLTNYTVKKAMKETRQKSSFEPFYDPQGLLIETGQASLSDADSNYAGPIAWDYATEHIQLNVFKSSKFIQDSYDEDKKNIINKYKEMGYRDAKITKDTMYDFDEKSINLELTVDEGNQYFIRSINWVGNSKFSTYTLKNIVGIQKGDIYNPTLIEQRLFMDPNGKDVSSLYMDDGYLFFQVTPVEVYVENDSVDLEIRIYEGRQARINEVSIVGNTKTNDHVIYRAIRTLPGNLFSRSDIIRSQRELSVLGYFDPQAMNVVPKPNPEDATVDIEYTVAEKPSDQIELSGGWGGGNLVGSAGIRFTNFSLKNILNFKEWRPLPSGDGQQLSLRFQTSGRWYSSLNMSFTEPWLGGKRPLSFSVSGFWSVQSNNRKRDDPARQDITIWGTTVGLGQQLKWPDDYFILRHEVSYQKYIMNKWQSFLFNEGVSNNIFYRITLNRNSLDQMIYPKMGSDIKVSLQLTPPYSAFQSGKDYSIMEAQEKYKWVEYYKWKFTCDWYTPVVQNLVFKAKIGFGFLGYYNEQIGYAPFERFYLGGSGLTGFQLDGREIIALRGYDDGSVSPPTGGTSIAKYTLELRYPLSLNPSATIYLLAFTEAGNSWNNIDNFAPFELKRSGGFGVRVFLPMFGLLGLDWGYRFDDIPGRPGMDRSQIHFTIGANLGSL